MTTDLSIDNGWIKEQTTSEVLQTVLRTSAVEQVARKVNMTSEFAVVPRFAADGVDTVAEHADIPLKDATLDEVELRAIKFANRFAQSVEDERDSIVSAFDAYKLRWASNFAVKLDHACLGTVGAANGAGSTRPFTSVYQAAGSGRRVSTSAGGAVNYEQLAGIFGALETGDYADDLVVIAHRAFAMDLRNLKDASGDKVGTDALSAVTPTLFGHDVVWTNGARTGTTATDKPTGNPLLIVASRRNLILGVRDGVEFQISDQPRWVNDEIELKMRARRGFAVADPEAFRIIEKLPAA